MLLAASAELAQSKIAVDVKWPGPLTLLGHFKATETIGVSMSLEEALRTTNIDIEMIAMR